MQRGEAWTPFAGEVARRGWPTVLIDFDEPTRDGCIAAIVAAAGGGVVVGYSMGGRIALQAAARHPGAFSGLVLVGATPGVADPAERRQRRAADEQLADWMEQRRIDAVVDMWQRQAVFSTQSEQLVLAQRPGRLDHDPRELAALLRSVGQGALEPIWDELPDLSMPVLAIAGELDEKYSQVAAQMADALPNGRVALVPGAGHAPQLEQHDAVTKLLVEFLYEHFSEGRVVDGDA
jgi:2-succinyl-6-hydroxy-2,4-cyclohexadiene-1-carboxylate synthase